MITWIKQLILTITFLALIATNILTLTNAAFNAALSSLIGAAEVTPARRGKGLKVIDNTGARSPAECHAAMTWAQRLKPVFKIDIEVCSRCGGSVKVIACI